MDRKRVVTWVVYSASFCLLAYAVFTLPKAKATQNCCLLPTSEQETAAQVDPYEPSEEDFKMAPSDPQGTDFANDPVNGEVGEYEYNGENGTDYCYKEAKNLGHPLTTPTPDGIGIAQLDGQQNPSYAQDCVYWNYRCNIDISLDILNGKQSAAYTFWSKQVAQSNSTPVPSGDNTSCDGSYFSYPQTGSWNFEDAEWIQSYNGTWPNGYFIAWNETNYPNQWHINYPYTRNGVTYDYVHQVCNASPY